MPNGPPDISKLDTAIDGSRRVLPVVSTTATAGIIVGTVTLTGLGLKISGLIVDLAGGYVFLTVLYSAIAIWMLGIAALAAGLGGWIRTTANALERTLATAGGLLLFYAGSMSDLAGATLFGLAVALHRARTKTGR